MGSAASMESANKEHCAQLKENIEGIEGDDVTVHAISEKMGADERNPHTAEEVKEMLKEVFVDKDSLPKAELISKLTPEQAAEVAEEAGEVAEAAGEAAEAAEEVAKELRNEGDEKGAEAMEEVAEAAEAVKEEAEAVGSAAEVVATEEAVSRPEAGAEATPEAAAEVSAE